MASSECPDPGINWATATITPHPDWIRLSQNKYRPEFDELANEAIAKSGRESNGVLAYQTTTGIFRLFHHHVLSMLDGNATEFPGAVQDCQAIISRQDYTGDQLWDYLTHWGAKGEAVYQLTAEYLAKECMPALVQVIQSGSWDQSNW